MNDDQMEKRLIEVINEVAPDVLGDLEPQSIEPVQIKRDSGFPMPNEIWQSTDGQTVPASWNQIEGYAFRIEADGALRRFATTNWPIVCIYPSDREDHLAVTLHDPYRHPGQRITRTLVRYPRIDNVAALVLLNVVEVPVELTPEYASAGTP